MKKLIKISFKLTVYGFALIGFVLVSGFFAVKFGLTKVNGDIDPNSYQYSNLASSLEKNSNIKSDIYNKEINEKQLICKIQTLGKYYPKNASIILNMYEKTYDPTIAEKMLFAVNTRLYANKEYITKINFCETEEEYKKASATDLQKSLKNGNSTENAFPWINDESWDTVLRAIAKDKDKIIKAGEITGVDPRLILASCIVEQLRLYHTQREEYEKFFKPLEILGNANKMAWGVMSIKEKTAIDIETNLKDQSSSYYLGKQYEEVLKFNTDNPQEERYNRLTNDKDHTYSYLYGGLYLHQLIKQWKNSGYDISDRPEILGTLFNLGFEKSKPKANPEVGGSTIEVGETKYTFGSLAYEFYYSGELIDDYSIK